MKNKALFLFLILLSACAQPDSISNVSSTIAHVTEVAASSSGSGELTPTSTKVPSNSEIIETAVPFTPTETSQPAVEVIINAANIRSGPGTNHSALGVARSGELLPVIGLSDDGSWYNVTLPDGQSGWIGSSVVQQAGDLSQIAVDEIEPPTAVALNTAIPVETPIPTGESPGDEVATVTNIIDGDTIEVSMNGQVYSVQYIGINSAENEDPCGPGATQANANLVTGQNVRLVKDVSDTDPFGRLLRYVYVGDLFVNAELVRQGWALPIQYPPDTSQAAYLESQLAGAPVPDCRQAPTASPVADQPSQPADQAGLAAGVPEICSCSGADLNCGDFGTHASAQACYNYCRSLGKGDFYNLDGPDGDGQACESLP